MTSFRYFLIITVVLFPLAARAEEPASTADFKRLMEAVAEGWRTNNAQVAASCFSEDAIYVEPPDRQVYEGRTALYEFFGGKKGTDKPMKMEWHHLAFDPKEQVGFGEYTFELNRKYHGIVVVKLRAGKIWRWREYQYADQRDFSDFAGRSAF